MSHPKCHSKCHYQELFMGVLWLCLFFGTLFYGVFHFPNVIPKCHYQQLFTGVLLRGLSRGVNVYWVQFESVLEFFHIGLANGGGGFVLRNYVLALLYMPGHD